MGVKISMVKIIPHRVICDFVNLIGRAACTYRAYIWCNIKTVGQVPPKSFKWNNKADGKICILNLIQFQLTYEDCFWTPKDAMKTRKTGPWFAKRKTVLNSLKRYNVTYCRKYRNFPVLLYSWFVATVTLCQWICIVVDHWHHNGHNPHWVTWFTCNIKWLPG